MILLIPLVGLKNVAGGVGEFAKWTQTLAVLEIVHSAIGGLDSLSSIYKSGFKDSIDPCGMFSSGQRLIESWWQVSFVLPC